MSTPNETPGAAGRVKLPMVMLLLVVMVGTLLGMAGGCAALYFMAKSGKLPLGQLMGASLAGRATTTHQVVMEPILVNLADDGGHAYLRLGLTLEVVDGAAAATAPSEGAAKEGALEAKEGAAPAQAKEAAKAPNDGSQSSIRDTVLTVLGRQNSATLLGPDGKEHLKIELREAIQKSDPQLNLKDLFLTEFLVQV
jgi:flagellar FliL protein